MIEILMQKLNIVIDGVWQTNEIIAAVVAALVVVLIIVLLIFIITRIVKSANPRKSTIFSHRKNRYKSRLGKNNKKYFKNKK